MYAQRGWCDPVTGLTTYEYISDAGSYRIEGLTFSQGFRLSDELEEAGEDRAAWERVLQRWAQGYRAQL
jgi:hypothetical protein